ncbi:MAG TPA: universal stress protein [Rubrobacter sp.]|nr:universal stress protein [Rubrobacter sp.]
MSERGPSIRRILVALDASPSSLVALEEAAKLAAVWGAELAGVFVEDSELLRMAQLPFMQTVGSFSATAQRLDTRRLELGFRADAGRVRRALERIAEKERVEWTFRVVRGPVASEILAAAREADLIMLGRIGWSLAGRRRVGSTVVAIMQASSCPTLILHQGTPLGSPVLVAYDGSETAQKALSLATLLRQNEPLDVLILADGPEAARALRDQAAQWLEQRGVEATFRQLVGADVETLARTACDERGGVLVIPAEITPAGGEGLAAFLNKIGCPALVVR